MANAPKTDGVNLNGLNGRTPIAWKPAQVALVFQGGGALGAYQAGVYQALHEAGIEPDWIIGTSIGAINACLIVGNEPANRVPALQEFWRRMAFNSPWTMNSYWPQLSQTLSQIQTITSGIPGFFEPNPRAFLGPHVPLGTEQAGYYSTAPLAEDTARACRLLAGRTLQAAADGRRRSCPIEPDEILRQPRHGAGRQAHHGVRGVAAGFSCGPDRRRTLLGRRHSLQYAERSGV